MAYLPPDNWDEYDAVLETATTTAMRQWFTNHVNPNLRPALVAATGDEDEDGQPPTYNLGALLAATAAWLALWDEVVEPTTVGLLAIRAASTLQGMGTPLDKAATASAPQGALTQLRAALQAVRNAGGTTPDADDIEWVVRVPGWQDFIDQHARARRNMVVGMPDTVHRDLVTKLAAAARSGDDMWERYRLVRGYLSWEDEGGYDQWMIRARRIARTEAANITTAADLQAARTSAQALGQDMHKVWVATLDPRTRDSHYALDGKRIPIDAKFMVGGHEADRPSDDRLPAHENINCRCKLMFVAADEDVPDDTDRQTERERTRNHQPVPARDPQDEVRHRARRGVTRAGDTGAHTITAATQNGDTPMRTQWTGTLAPVGKPTGDGRIFDTDADLGFREFPLPLMFQRATSDGHDTAVIVGKIEQATVDGGGVQAVGEFFDSADAAEAAELVGEGVLRPSVDLADMEVEWELVDADGNPVDPEENEYEDGWREVMHVRAATVIAATLVAKPAFAEAKIVVGEATEAPAGAEGEEAALVAAAALADVDTHPAAAFTDPNLTAPTPLTVTDEGHVYGHLALWGTEHVGMPGKGITPPRSRTNYALFHTSTARTSEGDMPVGRLTVGTGHANARAGVHDTTAHYDNTGTAWALVRAGEDAHGIWVAGVTCPDIDPASVRAGASAPLSGDWRNVGGNLELVAALSVNTPGFPVPRSYAATTGAELSLVAAGVTPRRSRLDEWADAVAEGLRRHEERKALAEDEAFEQAERLAATRRMAARVWASEVNR